MEMRIYFLCSQKLVACLVNSDANMGHVFQTTESAMGKSIVQMVSENSSRKNIPPLLLTEFYISILCFCDNI
jgi:hypothetical protein